MDSVREVTTDEGPRVVTREVSAAGRELEVQVVGLSDAAAGVVVTLRDVTEERRLDRARRDLVANVSHELKTPLSAIKGFQELLEDEHLSEETRARFLELMSKEITRMERLVEDQLQLARLDSGAFPLEREPVDLAELAAGVAEPRQVLATREGVSLSVYAPPGEPVIAEVDPARVEQILLILLDNALRHTPAGGRIRVAVERRGGDRVAVSVADDGDGIPIDAQPFVFDRFYRGDASRAGRSAGLGLAIARGLARAHGGEIELRSMPEVGSAFTVVLPANDPGAATPEEESTEPVMEHPVPSE
jgi:signal transduction histidine kinase